MESTSSSGRQSWCSSQKKRGDLLASPEDKRKTEKGEEGRNHHSDTRGKRKEEERPLIPVWELHLIRRGKKEEERRTPPNQSPPWVGTERESFFQGEVERYGYLGFGVYIGGGPFSLPTAEKRTLSKFVAKRKRKRRASATIALGREKKNFTPKEK